MIAANRYDETTSVKSDLVVGQHVRLLNKDRKRWEPAIITGQAETPRSYFVQRLAGGVVLRRNRVHLRPTMETFENVPQRMVDDEEDEETMVPPSEETNSAVPTAPTEAPVPASVEPGPRRSGRLRTQTQFYQAEM